MGPYRYLAYGLSLDSEIALPGLLAGPLGKPDVVIRYGEVPPSLPSPSALGVAWQDGPSRRLLSVVGVARYLIIDNREIVVEPEPNGRVEDIWVWLLGSILAALLYGRHILVLHASVVEYGDGAVLFAGRSGVGKSTLLAAMLMRGYSMLADDKTGIVVNENGGADVLPGFPLVRLTEEATDMLSYPLDGSTVRPAIKKYMLPVSRFRAVPAPLRAAYLLKTHNREDILAEPLSDLEGFEALRENLFRRRFVVGASQHLAMFRALSAAGRQARISRIVRPEHPQRIHDLVDRIEADLRASGRRQAE
jgi:hypothetical protein